MTGVRRDRRRSLTTRLLVSHIAVAVAMAVTVVVVVLIAGPPLFEAHMRRAGEANPEILRHSREALASAGLLSLGLGLVISVTGAVVAGVLIARRLGYTLAAFGSAARQIAEGDYSHRMAPGDSEELDALSTSFNTMAARLAGIEATRRRLLTDLAHEIRTPLANMDLCVESLEDGAMEPGPEAWAILHDQIRRITGLTRDMTEVSAAEEGRLQLQRRLVTPHELISSAVSAAHEAYERKGVALVAPTASDALEIDADPGRIGQVLANLLSNALRHTPAGGRVTVIEEEGDGVVRIRVVDTGEGIAPEHLPHIFERFYRADAARDREHGGTGVGLAISRAIVVAHGGRLTAESAGSGQGTAVTLELPAVPALDS